MADVVKIGKGRKKRPKFRFQIEGDSTVHRLPHMQHLDRDLLARLRQVALKVADPKTGKMRKKPATRDLLETIRIQRDVLERYCPGLYDQLADDQIAELMEAWKAASSVSLGESSASST